MEETPLAEARSVDDQVEWLDNQRILYGLSRDIWVVRADGSGSPRKFSLEGALACRSPGRSTTSCRALTRSSGSVFGP
jgi:hypothetical protein